MFLNQQWFRNEGILYIIEGFKHVRMKFRERRYFISLIKRARSSKTAIKKRTYPGRKGRLVTPSAVCTACNGYSAIFELLHWLQSRAGPRSDPADRPHSAPKFARAGDEGENRLCFFLRVLLRKWIGVFNRRLYFPAILLLLEQSRSSYTSLSAPYIALYFFRNCY